MLKVLDGKLNFEKPCDIFWLIQDLDKLYQNGWSRVPDWARDLAKPYFTYPQDTRMLEDVCRQAILWVKPETKIDKKLHLKELQHLLIDVAREVLYPKDDICVGDTIYINSSIGDRHEPDYYGGIATVSKIEYGISGGDIIIFVLVKEHEGRSGVNWTQFLKPTQNDLKEYYKDKKASSNLVPLNYD